MPRKTLGKKQRFAIFARDRFTCRYCGKQPPDVKLVIDHLIPVAEGGTNDDENLISACEDCNQGKGAKRLEDAAPTEQDAARKAQECLEQKGLADLARSSADARQALLQEMVNYWCKVFRENSVQTSWARRLASWAAEFGPSKVFDWIDQTAYRVPNEYHAKKYLCGIVRNIRNGVGGEGKTT